MKLLKLDEEDGSTQKKDEIYWISNLLFPGVKIYCIYLKTKL